MLGHWVQLALTEGIGPITIGRMIEAAGSAEAACRASVQLLRTIEGIGLNKANAIHVALKIAAGETGAELERAQAKGLRILCREDEAYPPLLRTIPDPPAVLYVKGTLEDRDLNAMAIVGSRRCSYYGREQAERFAALLAGAGMTVVSGGARGVDSSAHRGALSHPQGRTIAVLGCGVDIVYPPENVSLFEQVAARGAVISEYPLGTPPLAEHFPRRNRIISGMSRGVLVVEADERSGALITARQAADDHNRPVFAVPGRVDNPLSAGPHKLIRDGAVLAAKLEDILEELDPVPQSAREPMLIEGERKTVADLTDADAPAPPEPPAQPAEEGSSDAQRLILSHMGREAASVDLLIERTSLPAAAVLRELTFLSLKGVIRRIDGQSYARRR